MDRKLIVMVLMSGLLLPLTGDAQQQKRRKQAEGSQDVQRVHREARQMLGDVPVFLETYPDAALPGMWDELKSVQMSEDTALSGKYKELIGLAVAAQIPCDYCVYFHTKMARLLGATEDEVQAAVAHAAMTRHWSTVLNAYPPANKSAFAKQVDAMMSSANKAGDVREPVTDAKSAYADMQRMLGTVPDFMRRFPQAGIAGAWQAMRAMEMSPNPVIEPKYASMISLAVAAQIPCDYCVIWDMRAAKSAGASEQEIAEAIAMAAITRHWSTVLNGTQPDMRAFQRDVDRMVRHVRRQMQRAQR